jgi:parallel beta-helix repeat protein
MGAYEFQGTPTPPSGTIIKQAEYSEVPPSQFATYTIYYHATNTTSLKIMDIFNPSSLNYSWATPTPTTILPGSITWRISSYQPCTWGSITIVMQIATQTTPCTYITNTAELWSCGQILLATDTATVHVSTPTITGSVTVWDASGNFIGAYTTIQAGIDNCPHGGTVLVANGTYTGNENKNLTWSGKKITVCSENGAEKCIIDCENSGRGFNLNNAGDCGTISGFTIRNGNASAGGGIYCSSSSLTITNCIISENNANSYGGGIYCQNSSPNISSCIISENTKEGIYLLNSTATLASNCIEDCTEAGIYLNNSSPQVEGNTLIRNKYGIKSVNGTCPKILNNFIGSSTYFVFSQDMNSFPKYGTNTLYNNNYDAIEVLAGEMTVPYGTWSATSDVGLVYVLTGNPSYEYRISSSSHLNILPGQIIKFSYVWGYLHIYGTLTACGTPDNKIYFTSIKDDTIGGDTNKDGTATTPAKGDWYCILFESTGRGKLRYCQVCYSGYHYISNWGAIYIKNNLGEVDIASSTVSYSYNQGLWIENSTLTLTSNHIEYCRRAGIYLLNFNF